MLCLCVMIQQPVNRNCLACGKPLRGRADKKFCDDYCRNNYNNQLKGPVNNYVRNINNALGKNRRILDGLLPNNGGVARASKEKLDQLGFHFRYITHTHTTRTGCTYFFCYDCGYLPLEKGNYLIVRKKED